MRTTLDIEDGLLRQAKSFAAQEHISLTRLIEESLSLRLRAAQTGDPGKSRPFCRSLQAVAVCARRYVAA